MDFIFASHPGQSSVRLFLKNILFLCLFQIKYYLCDDIINYFTPSEVCDYY